MSESNKKPVALVTGASAGMGKDIAKALLEEGMVVYTAARRIEGMSDLQTLGAIPLKLDITVEEQIQSALQPIEGDHGGVDILINNAGFGMYGSVEETSLEDARYQFEVNMFGLARLTQLVIPYMRNQRAGKIINTTSVGGKVYTPLGSWYHATKHALEGWSDCLRIELKQFNIHVVIIEPGIIQTEFGNVMTEPMLERSGSGPYKDVAASLAKTTKAADEKGGGSSPQVITDLVLKAIKSPNPKPRYAGGKFAKPMIFMRWLLSDRLFDKVILSAF